MNISVYEYINKCIRIYECMSYEYKYLIRVLKWLELNKML